MRTLPVVVLFISPLVFAAQDPETARWLAGVQTAAGKAVRIQTTGGKRTTGVLLRGTDSSLVLRDRKGETVLLKSEVREIQLRQGRSRGRKMLLGGILGGSIGAGLGAAGTLASRLMGGEGGNDEKLVAIGIGVAAAGAGIGVAIGAGLPERYETLYIAPTVAPPPGR